MAGELWAPVVWLGWWSQESKPKSWWGGRWFVQERENITNIPAGLQPVPYRITLDPTAKVCIQRGLGLGKFLVAVPWVCGHLKSWWPLCGFLSPSLGVGVNEYTELLFPMHKLLLSGEIHSQRSPKWLWCPHCNYLFPLDPPKIYLLLARQQCMYQAKLGISVPSSVTAAHAL